MGWASCVGVIQHLRRQLISLPKPVVAGLPLSAGRFRERGLPALDQVIFFWQGFVDDSDVAELL